MKKINLKLILFSACIPIAIGILLAFIDLKCIGLQSNSSGYVEALFSLAGVILFVAALLFQSKELETQIEELKKSVKAQTKSSEALEDQKRILLEQNTNNLIFGIIESFNSFKLRNNIHFIIDKLYNYYQGEFFRLWDEIIKDKKLTPQKLNEKFALEMKILFSNTIKENEYYSTFKRYIQFIYNILYLIDENHLSKKTFTPFFLNQLNSNENVFIHLANLVDLDMPFYGNLKWGHQTTTDIIKMMKSIQGLTGDFKEIDKEILTMNFNSLKQSNPSANSQTNKTGSIAE